jgi:GNAT superfamily N-acetyltransferase
MMQGNAERGRWATLTGVYGKFAGWAGFQYENGDANLSLVFYSDYRGKGIGYKLSKFLTCQGQIPE